MRFHEINFYLDFIASIVFFAFDVNGLFSDLQARRALRDNQMLICDLFSFIVGTQMETVFLRMERFILLFWESFQKFAMMMVALEMSGLNLVTDFTVQQIWGDNMNQVPYQFVVTLLKIWF